MGDNYSLFDESEFQPRPAPESTALVIRAQPGRKLSKEQRSFNRLTKRIADLERAISSEREKLDLLLGRYLEEVAPLEQTLAKRQIDLARALAGAVRRLTLRAHQLRDLAAMLTDLCGEAFRVMKPDAATEAFYDEWAEVSYREEVQQEAEELKQEFAEEMHEAFGIDVDVSGFDDSPEGMARFLHHMQEQVRTAKAATPDEAPRRRKNPKRGHREEQAQEREALTRKSVRDIYLSLAKVLHPDAVTDAAERSRREEFMKQASFAYRQGDIAALFKLELRWVTRDDAGVQALTDEAIGAYLPALREQEMRLQRAFEEQVLDPRYAPIGHFAGMAPRTASTLLNDHVRALRAAVAALDQERLFVEHCPSKAALVRLVGDYLDAKAVEEDLDW